MDEQCLHGCSGSESGLLRDHTIHVFMQVTFTEHHRQNKLWTSGDTGQLYQTLYIQKQVVHGSWWIERSACNVDSTGSSPNSCGNCKGTLIKSFTFTVPSIFCYIRSFAQFSTVEWGKNKKCNCIV